MSDSQRAIKLVGDRCTIAEPINKSGTSHKYRYYLVQCFYNYTVPRVFVAFFIDSQIDIHIIHSWCLLLLFGDSPVVTYFCRAVCLSFGFSLSSYHAYSVHHHSSPPYSLLPEGLLSSLPVWLGLVAGSKYVERPAIFSKVAVTCKLDKE